METLTNDETRTAWTPPVPSTNMSIGAFMARAVAVVLLLTAAAFAVVMLAPHKTTTVTSSAPTAATVKATEDAKKIGFTFTDQWNKIELPNGSAIYSRCNPYVDHVRWTVDPAGNMSTSADPSCKKA